MALSAEITCIDAFGKLQVRDPVESGPFYKQGHVSKTRSLKMKSGKLKSAGVNGLPELSKLHTQKSFLVPIQLASLLFFPSQNSLLWNSIQC